MLHGNEITEMSTDFNSFVNLAQLRLDRNKLTSVGNLTKCRKLERLDLSTNRLSDPKSIIAVSSLLIYHLELFL